MIQRQNIYVTKNIHKKLNLHIHTLLQLKTPQIHYVFFPVQANANLSFKDTIQM